MATELAPWETEEAAPWETDQETTELAPWEKPDRATLQAQKDALASQSDVGVVGGFGRELAERAAQIPAGAATVFSGTLKALGATADFLDRNVLDLTPGDPTIEERAVNRLGEGIQGAAEALPQPPSPDLGHDVMRGVGQVGAMLATGAGGRALGLGRGAVAAAGTLAGTGAEFEDAFEQAGARGDDPDTRFAKSLGYATVSSLIENRLGAGRLLKRYFPNPTAAVQKLTALGVSKEIVKNFVAGAVEEGSQQFAQNWIVDETPSLKNVGRSALVGSLVEGVAGLPSAAVQGEQAGRPGEDALPPEIGREKAQETQNGETAAASAPPWEGFTPQEPPVQAAAETAALPEGMPPLPEGSPPQLTASQRMAAENVATMAALRKAKAAEQPPELAGKLKYLGVQGLGQDYFEVTAELTAPDGKTYQPGDKLSGGQLKQWGLDAQTLISGRPDTPSVQPSITGEPPAAPVTLGKEEGRGKSEEVPSFAARYSPETLLQKPAWVMPGTKLDEVLGTLRQKLDPQSGIDIAPIWKTLTPQQRQELAARGWVTVNDRNPNKVVLKIAQDAVPARKFYAMQAQRSGVKAETLPTAPVTLGKEGKRPEGEYKPGERLPPLPAHRTIWPAVRTTNGRIFIAKDHPAATTLASQAKETWQSRGYVNANGEFKSLTEIAREAMNDGLPPVALAAMQKAFGVSSLAELRDLAATHAAEMMNPATGESRRLGLRQELAAMDDFLTASGLPPLTGNERAVTPNERIQEERQRQESELLEREAALDAPLNDVIDDLDAIGKINVASMREFDEYFTPASRTARNRAGLPDIFTQTGGSTMDDVLKNLHAGGLQLRIETESQLAEAINSGLEARRQRTEGRRQLNALWKQWRAAKTIDQFEALKRRIREIGGTWEGVFGAPVWMTKAIALTALDVAQRAFVVSRNLTEAIGRALDHLRGLNLPGFDEGEALAWLTENIQRHKFSEQLERGVDTGATTAGTFESLENPLFLRRAQEPVIAAAARNVELIGGPFEAIRRWQEFTNGLDADSKVATGLVILRRLAAVEQGARGQQNAELERRAQVAQQEFFDTTFASVGQDLGRGVSMFQAFLAMSPVGKFMWARNRMERARQAATTLIAPDVAAAQQAMTRINAEGIEQATAQPDVQAAAHKAVDAAVQQQSDTPGTDLRNAMREEVLQELVTAGMLTAREAEIVVLHLDGGQAGTSLAQKFQAAGIADPVTRAKKILEQFGVKMKTATREVKNRSRKTEAGKLESKVDRLIREQIKATRLTLGKIIRQHYTQQDATGKSLVEKIVAASGLTGEAATALANVTQKRFEALVSKKKADELKRLLLPIKTRELARPGLAQRIIEATNAGQLDERQFWEALKDKLKLPEWTAATAADVRKRVDDIERIPTDQLDRRHAATQQLLTALDRAQGYSMLDLGGAFFITNLMFGLGTHAANTLGNALNNAGSAASEGLQLMAEGRPLDALTAMEAVLRGAKRTAGNLAGTLRTGEVPQMRATKIEPMRMLENMRFGQRGGVALRPDSRTAVATKAALETKIAGVLNAWKYNGRVLAAEDLLFFTPAYQAKLAMLTTRLYRQQGLSGSEARQKAREVLGFGQAKTEAAQQQATREGYTGAAKWRRVAEILEADIPEGLKESARDYALRTTLNNEPYGALGVVANAVQQAKQSDNLGVRVAATAIAPIINVPVNWFNESLNYSPIGFWRVLRGTAYGQKRSEAKTPEQWRDLRNEVASKAALGTLLLAALAMKLWPKPDDDEDTPVLYGSGPMTPQDREGWKASGAIPYSIRVNGRHYSYALSPMAVPLSILGTIMDRRRDATIYNVPSAERSFDNMSILAGYSVTQAAGTMIDQSFMLGIADLLETLSERNPELAAKKFANTFGRTVTSVVVPQELRAIDKRLDPRVYRPQDAEAALVQAMPFLRRQGQPALNGLGQEVTWPPGKRFTSELVDDPLTKMLGNLGAWPELPNRHETIVMLGREATDQEFEAYVKRSGEISRTILGKFTDDPDKLLAVYAATHESIPPKFLLELVKAPDNAERQRLIQRAQIAELISKSRELARKELGWQK